MHRVDGSLDYGQDGWDRFFLVKGRSWRDKDYRFLDQVFDLHKLSGSLLDVGCGLGDGEIFLCQKCPNVTEFHACDFSTQAIDTCKNNPNIKNTHFFVHDLMSQSFSRTYDTVICLQTLEHLPDPCKAFKALYDAADQLLIISVPYKNRRPDENHLWSFDENDFTEYDNLWTIAQDGLNIFWLINKVDRGFILKKQNVSIFKNVLRIIKRHIFKA